MTSLRKFWRVCGEILEIESGSPSCHTVLGAPESSLALAVLGSGWGTWVLYSHPGRVKCVQFLQDSERRSTSLWLATTAVSIVMAATAQAYSQCLVSMDPALLQMLWSGNTPACGAAGRCVEMYFCILFRIAFWCKENSRIFIQDDHCISDILLWHGFFFFPQRLPELTLPCMGGVGYISCFVWGCISSPG